MGTPDYMSPEQAANAHAADIRSDIYSLGCTLYFLLTGQPPSPEENAVDKASAHLHRSPKALAEYRPDVPPGLEDVLARMMAKNPEDRYQQPQEVAAALTPWCSEAGPTVESRERSVLASVAPRHVPITPLLLAATAIAVAFGAIVWIANRDPAQAALKKLTRAMPAEIPADPFEEEIASLRARFVEFRANHPGTPQAIDAARQMALLPWPADALRREDIPPSALKAAGYGDASQAPPELVAIFGDNRLGHWRNLNAVGFSPDGDSLYAGDWSGTASVWNVMTGELREARRGLQPHPARLAFSPAGTTAAVADARGNLKLVDLSSAETLADVQPHAGAIHGLAFSPDGKLLATTGADRQIVLVDAATGELSRPFPQQEAETRCAAFDPQGQILVTGAADGAIKGWRLDGQELFSVRAPGGRVLCAAFAPQGGSFATAGDDGAVTLWDAESGTQLKTLPGHPGGTLCVAFHPAGTLLASGGKDGRVVLWDIETGAEQRSWTLKDWVWSVAFDPRGIRLATMQLSEAILWDVATGEPVFRSEANHGAASSLEIDSLGESVVFTGPSGETRRASFKTRQEEWIHHAPCQREFRFLALSPAGDLLAAPQEDSLVLLNPKSGESLASSGNAGGGALSFNSDGRWLAVANGEDVDLCEVATAEQVTHTLPLGSSDVWAVAFGPKSDLLAAGGAHGEIRLWNVSTGEIAGSLTSPAAVTSLAFSPDGETLATIGWDHAPRLWDLASGQARATLPGHEPTLTPGLWYERATVVFSPDGAWLASAAFDGTVRVWNASTGEPQHVIRVCQRGGAINDLAFTPDGRHLLTANQNGTIYVLRLKSL
jgi:WD40 repeat protein